MVVAVVGATGLVGGKMLDVLQERGFPVTELLPVASEKSVGRTVTFGKQAVAVIGLEEAVSRRPALALFSAGGDTSLQWAPQFTAQGTVVVDNSSAWRMDPAIKLVVPEVNAAVLSVEDRLIANPNCSTIQLVMVLKPLHDRYRIRRVVVSTYQSVSGTGAKGINQLMNERSGVSAPRVYPHPIDLNAIPHIDTFQDNGYTREEMKMTRETCKIMGDDRIKLTATCVRVPTLGGHGESVNIEFEEEFDLAELRALLMRTPGVTVQDEPGKFLYPMPLNAHDQNDTFVGRLRRDESQARTLNAWIVSDNLRKGAATNAVQIAEVMWQKGFLKG